MLTRPKDADKRRVIVDLSYGEGQAVNRVTSKGTYEGEEFSLQLPTLDHVLSQILNLKNPKLVKADISRAFRNVPLDPRDAVKCGIQHRGQFYIDSHSVGPAPKSRKTTKSQ